MAYKNVVAVHGGAWDIPSYLWEESMRGVIDASLAAHNTLKEGGSAVDAVEAAVKLMEQNPAFDAGRGSVLTSEGKVEVSALIMRGDTLKAGAVAAARNILTPIVLARRVMEDTDHVLLCGDGANKFAESVGIKEHPIEDLLTEEGRRQLQQYKKYQTTVNTLFNDSPVGHDTVGCVALDSEGLLACGTSTGGISGQAPGRVGDSPLVGSGGYADNELGAAVSSTGHGESIMKVNLAHTIVKSISEGSEVDRAGAESLEYMRKRVSGRGGCVIVTRSGQVATPFNTVRMPWAYVMDSKLHWGMNPGDHDSVTL